jgi:hypothetical protein
MNTDTIRFLRMVAAALNAGVAPEDVANRVTSAADQLAAGGSVSYTMDCLASDIEDMDD